MFRMLRALLFVWQRRQWLSEAIDSIHGNDPIKLMLQDIQLILTTGNADDDDDDNVVKKQEALENLQIHTEDVDLANGYLLIFLPALSCCLSSQSPHCLNCP